MTVSNNHMAPQNVLDRIRYGRKSLEELWSGLNEEQMIQRPGPQEDWSVKDMISHIAWWESFVLERVTSLISGVTSEPAERQDIINARVHELHKDQPLSEVLAAFETNWTRWEDLISSLDDEQINTPAYYPTYDGIALLPIIGAGSFNHYPSHIADLHTYVESI